VVARPAVLKRAHSLGSGQLSPLSNPTAESISGSASPGSERIQPEIPDQQPSQPPPAELEAPKALGEPRGSTDHFNADKKKLLLVDDNNINLKVLSAIVIRLGYSYETAVNGQEAVNAYEADPEQFSGVLMDISMPIMDGLEATRRIRHHERKNSLPSRPVLALTGLSSDDTHKEALDSGVDVFLTKPVKFLTLREALASVGLSKTEESVPVS
jgi:CheY-like chemotaxis protein